MLLNNWDRGILSLSLSSLSFSLSLSFLFFNSTNHHLVPIQSLWKNEGNAKNVMIDYGDNHHFLVTIDQCVTCIQDENLLKDYRDKVYIY
jgi:hypothetical protein